MPFQVGIALENLKLGLREGCRKAAEIGVDSVQPHFEHPDVNLLALPSAQRREEARRIRDLGLQISGVCILPSETDYESAENMRRALFSWLEVARDLGAPTIPTRFIGVFKGTGKGPFGPIVPPPFDVAEAIRPAVEAAAAEGIAFAHETGLEPPEDVRDFLDAFGSPGIGANYDPANLCGFGFDWIGGVEILGRHIVHVHAKDARRKPDGGWGFEEMPLGQGQVGYDRFLRALRRAGYAGCLALEREGATDPVAEMAAAVRLLRAKIEDLRTDPGDNDDDR
jgi:sugar phosphate isomerase/epimerase